MHLILINTEAYKAHKSDFDFGNLKKTLKLNLLKRTSINNVTLKQFNRKR